MVRVIKYGKRRRVTWPSCESLLEFEAEDVRSGQTGINEWEYYIQCPHCKENIKVSYELARRN